MTCMKQHLFGLLDGDEKAEQLIQKLTNQCASEMDIFVLSFQRAGSNNSIAQQGEDAETGVPPGQQIGVFAGICPAIVGGAGQFMAADKITDVARTGETYTANEDAFRLLVRFGLSEEAAQEYKKKLAVGGTLVAIQVSQAETAHAVRRVFEEAHCQEIAET